MTKTKAEIDAELEQAWKAEIAHKPTEALAIYTQALADLEVYRQHAPPPDQQPLTRLAVLNLFFLTVS